MLIYIIYRYIYIYTWNPFDLCFDRKRPYEMGGLWSNIEVIQVLGIYMCVHSQGGATTVTPDPFESSVAISSHRKAQTTPRGLHGLGRWV